MDNIFSENLTFAIGIIAGLFAILAGHRLLIYRDKRRRADDAANELRKVLNQMLVDVRSDNTDAILNVFSIDKKRIKGHHVAYLNFRHHLKGECRNQYDDAWNQYHDDFIYQWDFDGSLRERLVKDIEDLLRFTEYRFFKNMSLIWQKIWWRIRFKIFGFIKKGRSFLKNGTHLGEMKKVSKKPIILLINFLVKSRKMRTMGIMIH